jgi:hypothetical protein
MGIYPKHILPQPQYHFINQNDLLSQVSFQNWRID